MSAQAVRAEILDALTDDGDTFELPDGRALRLRIEPDELNPFEEYGADAYGRIEDARSRRLQNDYGYVRPDGFNGNAEVIWTRDPYWWQPPADGPKRGTPEFDSLRSTVRDLLEFGMSVVFLEVLEGTDAYRQPIVRDVSSVGAIEPFPDLDYVRDVLTDLLAELDIATEEG